MEGKQERGRDRDRRQETEKGDRRQTDRQIISRERGLNKEPHLQEVCQNSLRNADPFLSPGVTEVPGRKLAKCSWHKGYQNDPLSYGDPGLPSRCLLSRI